MPEQLDSIGDTLPAGFTYTAGSTTGATTTDPSVVGQQLTFTGPPANFDVPAGGSISLHFGVTVSSIPSTYTNSASATGSGLTIVPALNVAPVTVTGATCPTTTTTSSTSSTSTTEPPTTIPTTTTAPTTTTTEPVPGPIRTGPSAKVPGHTGIKADDAAPAAAVTTTTTTTATTSTTEATSTIDSPSTETTSTTTNPACNPTTTTTAPVVTTTPGVPVSTILPGQPTTTLAPTTTTVPEETTVTELAPSTEVTEVTEPPTTTGGVLPLQVQQTEPAAQGVALARTGEDVSNLGMIGLGLLAAGAVVLAARRRLTR